MLLTYSLLFLQHIFHLNLIVRYNDYVRSGDGLTFYHQSLLDTCVAFYLSFLKACSKSFASFEAMFNPNFICGVVKFNSHCEVRIKFDYRWITRHS